MVTSIAYVVVNNNHSIVRTHVSRLRMNPLLPIPPCNSNPILLRTWYLETRVHEFMKSGLNHHLLGACFVINFMDLVASFSIIARFCIRTSTMVALRTRFGLKVKIVFFWSIWFLQRRKQWTSCAVL